MTELERRETDAGRLARLGFLDAGRAARLLAAPPLALLREEPEVVASLGGAADSDAALTGLARMLEAAADPAALAARIAAEPVLRARLVAVLGVSVGLADHLARHPGDAGLLAPAQLTPPRPGELRRDLLGAVGAAGDETEPVATRSGGSGLDALRVAYRRRLLHLAARDLTGEGHDVQGVAAELADLAGATLEAALALARAELPATATPCRLAVIGMGKCGGRELNYVSDVDVVFVAEPVRDGQDHGARDGQGGGDLAALRTATTLAAALMRACSTATAEGAIWEVDAALRPEGKAGPLVRTLASHLAYYRRWARTWEFQALLKARPVAGDQALGAAYVEGVSPLVWQAAAREGFVEDVQAMRRRVESHVPAAEAARQLKLGPGGLRDVEFAVQLLQLVHGRADETLRSPNTLEALAALSAGGYVGREDAAALAPAYRFLRTLEHRIQLHRLRRTHLVPQDPVELRRLGRSLGYLTDPVEELQAEWRRHAREVRRLHEKLFYRPLLNAVARLDPGEVRLTPDAARVRLTALGYTDPTGALRHIEALTAGVSRTAAIQRTLLPVLLRWFADAADPDAGLLAFRQVSDTLGATPWFLRLLRDEGAAAERMARVLASSRYSTDLLLRAPEAVAMLADDAELQPRAPGALTAEVLAAVRRQVDPTAATALVRAVRRRELFRTAAGDVLGAVDVDAVAQSLTRVAAATLAGGLEAAVRAVEARSGQPLPSRLAVIGMGRLGGREMSYASDADVLFVCEPLPGAEERAALDTAQAVAHELRRLLALPAPDPPLLVDADLRPEGRQGPLVRTLASYAAYYARWSHAWESQALLRAEPVAGDAGLGERFVALVDPLRFPEHGLDEAAVREIRRIKARVEAERLPRGADPSTHTKLGRGGLADVEWTVQLLQLRHAARLPGLRTTSTLAALAAARDGGLVSEEEADVLAEAWRLATRVRNAVLLVRGRPGDSLPTGLRELRGVARLLGYPPGDSAALSEDYRRVTRRARAVVERVFYDR